MALGADRGLSVAILRLCTCTTAERGCTMGMIFRVAIGNETSDKTALMVGPLSQYPTHGLHPKRSAQSNAPLPSRVSRNDSTAYGRTPRWEF